jgi:metal-dependent amidase/aminoacylase/carboxypeptidase family protein
MCGHDGHTICLVGLLVYVCHNIDHFWKVGFLYYQKLTFRKILFG